MAVPGPQAVPVQISVQTPASWWVTGLVDSLSQFQDFERKLSVSVKHFRSGSHHKFETGDLVVVKQPGPFSDFNWCRGTIRCVLESVSKRYYKVFLVDYGTVVRVKPTDVQACPSDFAAHPFQAKLVRLYGLLPGTIDFDLCNDSAPHRLTRCLDWTERAIDFAKDLYLSNRKAYFVKKGVESPDREGVVVFGDLTFEIGSGELISVSDELVQNRHAIVSPEEFQREYMSSKSHHASQPRQIPKDDTADAVREARRKQMERLEAYRRAAFGSEEDLQNPTSGSVEKNVPNVEVKKGSQNFSNAMSAMVGSYKMSRASELASLDQSSVSPTAARSPKSPLSQTSSDFGSTDRGPISKTTVIIPAGFEIKSEPRKKESPRISKAQSDYDDDDWSPPSSQTSRSKSNRLQTARWSQPAENWRAEHFGSRAPVPLKPNSNAPKSDDSGSSRGTAPSSSARSVSGRSDDDAGSTRARCPLLDLLRKGSARAKQDASVSTAKTAGSVSAESEGSAAAPATSVEKAESLRSNRSSAFASEAGEEPNPRMSVPTAASSNTKVTMSATAKASSDVDIKSSSAAGRR